MEIKRFWRPSWRWRFLLPYKNIQTQNRPFDGTDNKIEITYSGETSINEYLSKVNAFPIMDTLTFLGKITCTGCNLESSVNSTRRHLNPVSKFRIITPLTDTLSKVWRINIFIFCAFCTYTLILKVFSFDKRKLDQVSTSIVNDGPTLIYNEWQ